MSDLDAASTTNDTALVPNTDKDPKHKPVSVGSIQVGILKK